MLRLLLGGEITGAMDLTMEPDISSGSCCMDEDTFATHNHNHNHNINTSKHENTARGKTWSSKPPGVITYCVHFIHAHNTGHFVFSPFATQTTKRIMGSRFLV